MKTFIVIVDLDSRGCLCETFVIQCESIDDPKFKEQLFDWIPKIGDGTAGDCISNRIDDDDCIFEKFAIYEVTQQISSVDIVKDFIADFKRSEEAAEQIKQMRDKESRKKLYDQLNKEFGS